jgi:hypothetical protein
MKALTMLGIGMVAIGLAFAAGRVTAPDSSPSPEDDAETSVVLRIGNQLQVPAIDLFCTAFVELQVRKVLCNRTGSRPRYQVIFERDRTAVVRIGDPGDQQVFPERP